MVSNRKKGLALHLHSLILSSLNLRKPKKWWVHPLWQRRREEGAYQTLVKALETEDPEYFKKYLRMSPQEYKKLKQMVHPLLKKYPAGRKALSVGHRLAIGIRYLASGDSLQSISFSFRVSFSTAYNIAMETCDALWKVLQPVYLAKPTEATWKNTVDGFLEKWNFPNCSGAVDGKHVHIQAPPKSGTIFYNYKGFFSTVLMAVVDHNYKFLVADIGSYGSNSDGGIWKSSEFGKKFDTGKVGLPSPTQLPNSNLSTPIVMLGDEAFQLAPNFMRPYPGKQLTDPKRVYNYRLSRARRCSENAFGIMANRWRILRRSINLKPANVDRVVKACIVLHNFLKTEAETNTSSFYCPPSYCDQVCPNGDIMEGEWRQQDCSSVFNSVDRSSSRNFSKEAENVRQTFVNYFISEGIVSWQWERAYVQSP